MKSLTSFGFFVVAIFMVFLISVTIRNQYDSDSDSNSKTESSWESLYPIQRLRSTRYWSEDSLPRGVVESESDMELKPLWEESRLKGTGQNHRALLAISVGIKQKENVDSVVRKFIAEKIPIMLFHYDGCVDGWTDLEWNDKAIRILAHNQTKWWFAKRFLHPDVSVYDYIFLWDEDLGVKNFHPGRLIS